ncbi:MAG: chromate transporter [Rhodobacteraceae bacterium]|nr:chromate transporter [Paracoccaceae bacterium]
MTRQDTATLETEKPTVLRLLLVFTRIGLTSFGGGLSGLFFRAFVQDYKWMTEEEFLNGLAISQALPGVNIKNMAIWIGYHLGGFPGAVVGFFGIIGPPAVFIVFLGVVFAQLTGYPITEVALEGAAAAAIGLSLSMGLTAAWHVRRAVLPFVAMVVTFVAIGLLQLPMLWVLLVVGAISIVVEYRRTGS